MVERMFAGEEKQSLERLKEEARVAKELQLTPVWPVKSEPGTAPVTTNTVEATPTTNINGRRDSPCDESKMSLTPKVLISVRCKFFFELLNYFAIHFKVAPMKFTRKEGEGYRSEMQEYKDVKMMVEDVKNNGRIKESIEMNHSTSMNENASATSGSTLDSKPYDEWEAIQRELALYPDPRDRDDMVGYIIHFVSDMKLDLIV